MQAALPYFHQIPHVNHITLLKVALAPIVSIVSIAEPVGLHHGHEFALAHLTCKERIIQLYLMHTEPKLFTDEMCLLFDWIDLDRLEYLLDHLLNGREVVLLVAVIGMIVNDFVVLPDFALNASILVNEIIEVLSEPIVSLIVTHAPVSILGRVLTVCYANNRESVLGI